jgi:uncharacterized protein (TIGR02145 family)
MIKHLILKCSFLVITGTLLISCKKEPKEQEKVTDFDGNVYTTVTLGRQVWMAENLKVTHYNNGDIITKVTSTDIWKNLTTEAYCDYQNLESNSTIYGRLYNHYAVSDPRKLCPVGWHLPTYQDWSFLSTFPTDQLKEVGTSHWLSPNSEATNITGFTALPSGINTIGFSGLGTFCNWWSSINVPTSTSSGFIYFYNIDKVMTWTAGPKFIGRSVRCIKD